MKSDELTAIMMMTHVSRDGTIYPMLPEPSISIYTLPWLRVPWDHPFPLTWGSRQLRPRYRYTHDGVDGEVVGLLTVNRTIEGEIPMLHGFIIGVDCPSVMKFLPFDVHDPVLDTLPADIPKVVSDYYKRPIITRLMFGMSYSALSEPRIAAEKAWFKYWKRK